MSRGNMDSRDPPPPYSPSPRTSLEPSQHQSPDIVPHYHEHLQRRRTFPLVAHTNNHNDCSRDAPYNPDMIPDPEGVGTNLPFTDEETTSRTTFTTHHRADGVENIKPPPRNQLYPNLGDFFPEEHAAVERKSLPTGVVVEVPPPMTRQSKRSHDIGKKSKNTFV